MHKSELAAAAPAAATAIPTVPVICDQCRQTGLLGEGPFSALPDILNFQPVQRRAHANGWREEHQRAFIAALAITGSPKQAARAIGRHQFGAEQLRSARGGKGFAEAWDAAMELAREREVHRIHGNLAELAQQRDAALAAVAPSPAAGAPRRSLAASPEAFPPGYDPEVDSEERLEYLEGLRSIRSRLLNARRLLLMLLSADPEKRAAWEVLVGPVDWARAERCEPQDDEPCPDPERNPSGLPSMRKADMVLTVEAGLLPELTGGEDLVAKIRAEVESYRKLPHDEETDAMLKAIAAAREHQD